MNDTEHTDADRPRPPLPSDEPASADPPATPPAAPPAVSPRGPQLKSPPLAAVLSFILPGLGHLYTESYQRSAMLFSSFVLAIFLAGRWWPFVFLCVFLWFFGMFDSFREAQIFNLGGVEQAPPPERGGEGRLMFGVFLLVGGGILLLDNFGLVDFDWFFDDWWPAVVVLAGLYFIVSSFRGRRAS
jgi:hypothetical protein